MAGSFAAILIIIAFLDESLLETHLFGRNLFWYADVFGTVTAISRVAISEEFLAFDPERSMALVAQHTHYMPKSWRGAEKSEKVRSEFESLFQYTGMMLLEEMISIFVTPYVLFFLLPERVDDILQFIVDFTDNVEGVGDVCSLSVFDFEHYGNRRYDRKKRLSFTLGKPYSEDPLMKDFGNISSFVLRDPFVGGLGPELKVHRRSNITKEALITHRSNREIHFVNLEHFQKLQVSVVNNP